MRISRMESLRRQRAAGKAVDVNLAAARSGGWTGQRLQIGLQIVGIVGQRLQIGSAQDQGARVLRRIDADLGAGVFLHRHFLLFGGDGQLQVRRRSLRAAPQIHRNGFGLLQPGRGSLHAYTCPRPNQRSNRCHRCRRWPISPAPAALDTVTVAPGHQRARFVGDHAMQHSGGLGVTRRAAESAEQQEQSVRISSSSRCFATSQVEPPGSFLRSAAEIEIPRS